MAVLSSVLCAVLGIIFGFAGCVVLFRIRNKNKKG